MKQDYSLTPRSRSGRARKPIEIMMTPMIDVIFLLLVFFLATSTFQLVEQTMPSSVSASSELAGGAAQAPTEPSEDALNEVVVKLQQADGTVTVWLNDGMLERFADLDARLQAIATVRTDVPVIIDPDDAVQAASVVQAYDWARQAGLSRVFLATRRAN